MPEIRDDLLKKRSRAISVEFTRENFLIKHCNTIYHGTETESFIDIKDLQLVESINDYGVVETFVFSIEEKYGVTVRAIGFDRYNSATRSCVKSLVTKIRTINFSRTDNPKHEMNE